MNKTAKIICTILMVAFIILVAWNIVMMAIGGQEWFDSAWEWGFIVSAPPVSVAIGLLVIGTIVWVTCVIKAMNE